MKLNEIMDLYNLYDKPEQLSGYNTAYETVPQLAWKKYQDNEDLDARKDLWLKDPKTAKGYAGRRKWGQRWPEAEAIIATDPESAYLYALSNVRGRWEQGEPVIATDPQLALMYARYVLFGRFPAGEQAIKSNPVYWKMYQSFLKDCELQDETL